jgi:ribosomal protein L15
VPSVVSRPASHRYRGLQPCQIEQLAENTASRKYRWKNLTPTAYHQTDRVKILAMGGAESKISFKFRPSLPSKEAIERAGGSRRNSEVILCYI